MLRFSALWQLPAATVAGRRRLICVVVLVLLAGSALTTATADASDWMYRRSYFTESAPAGQPTPLAPDLRSRWAYRPALAGTGFGAAIRGGYRFNRIFLGSGQSTDLTVIREDWFDVRP